MKVIPMSPNLTSGLKFEELTTSIIIIYFFKKTIGAWVLDISTWEEYTTMLGGVLLSGHGTEETTLLTIGDYSTPLDEWTSANATVPATRGLKVGI